MDRLPALSAKQVIKVLRRLGFREDRQKGSHLVLIHSINNKRVVIPVHAGKTIKRPLLKAIIERDAGVSVQEFLSYL